MGFLIELPELLEGRVKLKGSETEVTAMAEMRCWNWYTSRLDEQHNQYEVEAYLRSKPRVKCVGLKTAGWGNEEGRKYRPSRQPYIVCIPL